MSGRICKKTLCANNSPCAPSLKIHGWILAQFNTACFLHSQDDWLESQAHTLILTAEPKCVSPSTVYFDAYCSELCVTMIRKWRKGECQVCEGNMCPIKWEKTNTESNWMQSLQKGQKDYVLKGNFLSSDMARCLPWYIF